MEVPHTPTLPPLPPLSGLAAAALDAGIHKKTLGSEARTLIISNKEMRAIMKAVKSVEDSHVLKRKNKRVGFLICC